MHRSNIFEKAIIKEMYIIPTLEELVPKLSHKTYYTVFDIKNGFYHIQLDDESSKYCSFNTIYGTYRLLRAPFGLKNIPAFFQKLVYKYFGDIPGVTIYRYRWYYDKWWYDWRTCQYS